MSTDSHAVNGPPARAHRQQARPAARRHQPPPLTRSQRRPLDLAAIDPPALGPRLGHPQRLTPAGRRQPARPGRARGPVQADIAMHRRQGIGVDPGGAELAALGQGGRHPEQHRQAGRMGRRRGRWDLERQQEGELAAPQPRRQHHPCDRGVAGQLPAPVPDVRGAVRLQPAQRVDQHRSEISLQVLDGHVRLGRAPPRQVRLHVADLLAVTGAGLRVAERHRRGHALRGGPLVERRQHAHVLVPGRRSEPRLHRPSRAMGCISTQRVLQPLPGIEHPDADAAQEAHPIAQYSCVGRPRGRCRGA